MEKSKTTTIQIKMSPEVKAEIERRATQVNTTVSDYIRTVATSDEAVIVLDKGSYIARTLIEIGEIVKSEARKNSVSTTTFEKLLTVLEDINEKFCIITEQLSDIHGEESEDDYVNT